MAESIILGALLPLLFEKAASLTPLLISQFKSLFGADIPKEISRLQNTLSTIQAVMQDAEQKQLKDSVLRLWLARLKDAAHDANDILDEFEWEILRQKAEEGEDNVKNMVRRLLSTDNPILFRVRMGRRIKEIAERFHSIAAEMNEFNLIIYGGTAQHGSGSSRTETHSFVIVSDVWGRKADIDRIVEILISFHRQGSLSVLPIVGMGGLGKTTLAQMVYNDRRITDHFQLLMWVCVSDEFDVPRLVREIIKAAGGGGGNELADASMDSLQCSLREKLSSKRYLLVLDDLWNENPDKWEEVRVLLSQGAQGSAVLATTRSEKVSSIMGTIDSYKLELLSEEDCWTVFQQSAFANAEEVSQNLLEIGKKIVKKFGGLPLAAKTVGSFMRLNKDEGEWLSILHSEIWDLPPEGNKILPALRLSYDHMPSHLKECFAYCAIFPKDYPLKKDDLVQLWMANGFIPCGNKKELEAKACQVFNELVSRSFFQNVEQVMEWRNDYVTTTNCKMHDLIHDLARDVTKNDYCILDSKEIEENPNSTLRHLSFGSDANSTIVGKALCSSNSEIMHTLFKFGEELVELTHSKALQCVWSKTNTLRVLSLPNICSKELPKSIENLKHLRYLDLSRNPMETLPEAITRLFHLQTLKLECCYQLRELPKGMKNMKSLVHLYLGGCDMLTCLPRGIGNLIYLQTLSMFVVGSKTDSGSIRELKELNIRGALRLRGLNNVKSVDDAKEACLSSKHNLQTVSLSWSISEPSVDNIEEIMECLQPHQNIQRLTIENYVGINFPNWMMMCAANLKNLVRLKLSNCSKCEHLPALGQLRFLEFLHIQGMNGVKYLGYSQSTFYGRVVEIFPSLKQFYLCDMPNLEEWLGMEETGASSFFPQLINLEIKNSTKLTALPHLPYVRELCVERCPLLLLQKQHFLQMNFLRDLSIFGSSKLISLLTEEEVGGYTTSFGHLESLKISSCDDLISLSDEFLSCLISLKNLRIDECNNLVGSLSLSSSSSSLIGGERGLQLQHLTSLEYLDILWCDKLVSEAMELPPCLKKLDLIGCTNIHSLPEDMGRITTLRSIYISALPGLVSLPKSLGCLTALENLYITSCDNLTSLPDGLGCLTSLRNLEILSCKNLTSLPDGLGRLDSLEELQITDCPSLTTLPEWLGHLTGLRYLYIGSHVLVSLPQSIGCLTLLEKLSLTSSSNLTSLPHGLWGLTQLKYFSVYNFTELTSLPEGLEGLTKLEMLAIEGCPKLTSWPKSLQQQLPKLKLLHIDGSPILGRRCEAGGKYWHLVSDVPTRKVRYERCEDNGMILGGCSLRSTLCSSCYGGNTHPQL